MKSRQGFGADRRKRVQPGDAVTEVFMRVVRPSASRSQTTFMLNLISIMCSVFTNPSPIVPSALSTAGDKLIAPVSHIIHISNGLFWCLVAARPS